MFSTPFAEYQEQLAKMYKEKHILEDAEEGSSKPSNRLTSVLAQIDQFIEGPYAEAVFSFYKEKKPTLIRIRTGEEYSWNDAFGDSFDNVSRSLKHSLVGLVEGGGRYKIKE